MHYKIDKESQLHKDVTDYFDRKRAARRTILEYLKAEFGSNSCRLNADGRVIGLGERPTENPALWKVVNGCYMPKMNCKRGKDIAKGIANLPAVPKMELIRLLKYPLDEFQVSCGATVGYAVLKDGTVLISTNDETPYTPVDGMIEMLGSEYEALVAELRKSA